MKRRTVAVVCIPAVGEHLGKHSELCGRVRHGPRKREWGQKRGWRVAQRDIEGIYGRRPMQVVELG